MVTEYFNTTCSFSRVGRLTSKAQRETVNKHIYITFLITVELVYKPTKGKPIKYIHFFGSNIPISQYIYIENLRYFQITTIQYYSFYKCNYIFEVSRGTGAQAYGRKRDRLWIRFPLEEMKCLMFSFLCFGVFRDKARHCVPIAIFRTR